MSLEEKKREKKNGRPSLPSAKKKQYKLTVKMATRERLLLKTKAKSAGLSLSEFARKSIESSVVKNRISSEEMREIRQISGMANNLNQIARLANTVGYINAESKCHGIIEVLDELIQQIKKNDS